MINVQLYTALCQCFGAKNVIPVKQGMKGQFKFGVKSRVVNGKMESYRTICKTQENRSLVGEEFRVPCPFCRDSQPRLYINHLFGTKDRVSGQRYLWLANCYNEGCMSDFKNRKDLFEMLLDKADLSRPLNPGKDMPTNVTADWPGDVWPLADYMRQDPKGLVTQFVYARAWDADELTEKYDVRVIMTPAYMKAWLRDRIIVPVYGSNEELKTWSARRIHDDDSPKWLHCPHVGTGNAIYGLATAKHCRVPRIVEGPADCFPHRGTCAGVFGKVVQQIKARRLAKAFANAKAIALCLDPNQDIREYYEGAPHHIEVAAEELAKHTDVPIIKVYLPKTSDPGGLDADIFNWHIARCADEQEIRI